MEKIGYEFNYHHKLIIIDHERMLCVLNERENDVDCGYTIEFDHGWFDDGYDDKLYDI